MFEEVGSRKPEVGGTPLRPQYFPPYGDTDFRLPISDFPLTTHTGTIALVGRPNVGKSSLLNAILGSPLSMVSGRPQATRIPTVGIHTTESAQLILRDLPGLFVPKSPLQRSLRFMALEGLAGADVILQLHPANDAPAPALTELISDLASPPTAPTVVAYTKADLATPVQLDRLNQTGAITISRDDPESISRLIDHLAGLLPVRPFQHDPDSISTQPVRFFVGEYLREAAFELLREEVPYAVTISVEEFREEPQPVYIRATLYVERQSQKGIVIGKGGLMLRQLGSHARARLEALLGEPVYLDTRVKVLPNWRRHRGTLARFGLPLPPDETPS